jgi:hypothetical protein
MQSTAPTGPGGRRTVHIADGVPNIHGRLVAEARVGGVWVSISKHTVERWVERVRPSLAPHLAIDDLLHALSVAGDLRYDGPDWASRHLRGHSVAWVWIGDGIALPLDQQLEQVVAFTVATRCGLGDAARLRRSEQKRRSAGPTRPMNSGTSRRLRRAWRARLMEAGGDAERED